MNRALGLAFVTLGASLLSYLALLAGLVTCARAGTEPAAGAQAPPRQTYLAVRGLDFDGAIVPPQRAAEFSIYLGSDAPEAYWTPSEEQVLELEDRVESYFKKQAPKPMKALWKRLAEYHRQYVGIVVKGRKLVYCNYFCDANERDWMDAPVQVLDGGTCYFDLSYDVDEGRFVHLRIHGEA